MYPTFSWFDRAPFKGKYVPGAIIATTDPDPHEWEVLSVESERNEQATDSKDWPSLASIRLKCRAVSRPKTEANMRIYVQVPLEKTEFDTPNDRAGQAEKFEPPELSAYRMMSEDSNVSKFTPALLGWKGGVQDAQGLVPGGFHITVVWENVPGVRLSMHPWTADEWYMFWTLAAEERDKIRGKFKETFLKMSEIGMMPTFCSISNLVWDMDNEVLYWVGFREWDPVKTPIKWSEGWLAGFNLAKPMGASWSVPDWNGDTSGWKF